MPGDDLKHLPIEVKILINDGVYSLYAVKNRPGVAYVLLTNAREVYPLSADGDVVQGVQIKRLDELEIGGPAYFHGLGPRPALKLNYT